MSSTQLASSNTAPSPVPTQPIQPDQLIQQLPSSSTDSAPKTKRRRSRKRKLTETGDINETNAPEEGSNRKDTFTHQNKRRKINGGRPHGKRQQKNSVDNSTLLAYLDESKKTTTTTARETKKFSFSASTAHISQSPYGNYPLYYQYRYKTLLKKRVEGTAPDGTDICTEEALPASIDSKTLLRQARQRQRISAVVQESSKTTSDATTFVTIAPEDVPFPFDPRLKAIEHFIQQFTSSNTIIDLGANLGMVGLQMLAMNTNVNVLCIERDSSLVNRSRMLVETLKPDMCVAQIRELCFNSYHQIENKVLKEKMRQLREETKRKDAESNTKPNAETENQSSTSIASSLDLRLIPIQNRIQLMNGNIHQMGKFWAKLAKREPLNSGSEPLNIQMITCFSLIKWIHLTYGDESVRQLFQRVHDALAPGGYFVLETAPWKSYKRRRKASKKIMETWSRGLNVHPREYETILTGIGFKLVEHIAMTHESNWVEVEEEGEQTTTQIEQNVNVDGTAPDTSTDKETVSSTSQRRVQKKIKNGYLERPVFVYQKDQQ